MLGQKTEQIDLLAKFLLASKEYAEIVDDRAVLALTLSMVKAGSDAAGRHTCVGKNVALLEAHKLVPTMLRAFEVSRLHLNCPVLCRYWQSILRLDGTYTVNESCQIQLKEPDTEWKSCNLGFVETYTFFVRSRRRRSR